jgi:hypothetical protein
LALCCVFVLFPIPSTSFIFFELKHLHHLISPTCCLSISLTPTPSLSPCLLAFAFLLHVHLIRAYFAIATLCACFRSLATYPLSLHMFCHRCIICLLLPTCSMFALFKPTCCLSALFTPNLSSPPYVPTSTYLLHVHLVHICFAITTLHAYFHLLIACPPH